MPSLDLNPNSQKTHYFIDTFRRKRQKSEENSHNHTPFPALLDEDAKLVSHRYNLYRKVWGHQLEAIQRILNSANDSLYAELVQFITDPLESKLSVAYLALSSNTANNLRILDDFSNHVRHKNKTCQHARLVSLNSKACFNVKAAIREVTKQVMEPKEKDELDDYAKLEDEEVERDDQEQDDQVDENADFEEDGGRISYDFEIVEDWVDRYKKTTSCGDSLRLIIIFEDTNAFSNEVLNQLVQLFCVYSQNVPIKLIMGLSSKNVSNWVSNNITSGLRTMLSGYKLEAKDNKDISFQVIDDILLQNEITPENPLLLDAQLSLIILNRFENSNNSIDSLITEIKLTYMIHFYQLPLASLVDPSFKPLPSHCAALRKLPSFKTHMEYLVNNYNNEKSAGNLEEAANLKIKILELLNDDQRILLLLRDAKFQLQRYQNSVMNAIHLIHSFKLGKKEKFHIYKMVTNNQLINSAYLSDILKQIKGFTKTDIMRVVDLLNSDIIKASIDGVPDEDILGLRRSISTRELHAEQLLHLVTSYLHENPFLNMKISDNLFNEVLTINGGFSELDELRPKVMLEEKNENLMISLIRPRLREIVENALDEPHWYLRNQLILDALKGDKIVALLGPILANIYQVYKEAPVNINIWDFFLAFKLSIPKTLILKTLSAEITSYSGESKDLMEHLLKNCQSDDSQWERLVYAWFLQSIFELISMGFLREKSKGDYVEKMIWKNL